MQHKLVKSDGTEITKDTLSSFSFISSVSSDSDIKIGSACSDVLNFTLWGSSDVGLGALLDYYKIRLDILQSFVDYPDHSL